MEALAVLAFVAMGVCLVLFCVAAVVLWRSMEDRPDVLAARRERQDRRWQERRDRRWSRQHRYYYWDGSRR